MREEELYSKIVSKYPSYSKVPQAELMPKIYAKYPQYRGQIDEAMPEMVKPREARNLKDKLLDFGGGPMFVAGGGKNVEDTLPMVGQMVGGSIPGINSFGGSVGGATLGQAMRQGVKSIKGEKFSLPSVGKEALATATTEAIFRVAGKAVKPFANRLMNSVLKPARRVLERNPNIGLEAVEAGLTGTKSGILKKAGRLISNSENQLDNLIKSAKGDVNVLDIASNLDDLKRGYANIGDQAGINAVEEVQNALLNKSQTGLISVQEANQLKRDFYNSLKSSVYGTSEVPAKTAARKAAAGQIKRGIETVLPESKKINKKIGLGIEVEKALEGQIAQGQRNVILPKLAGMGAGAAAMTGNPLTAAGILLGDRGVDLLRSTPFVSGLAKNVLRVSKAGKPLTIGASEIARRMSKG